MADVKHEKGTYYHNFVNLPPTQEQIKDEKNKLLEVLKKASTPFAKMISNTHFYEGSTPQRGILAKYGNWPLAMLFALSKDGKKVHPNGKFSANSLSDLLPNCPVVPPKNKLRLALPPFASCSRLGSMPEEYNNRGIVITVPDKGGIEQKQTENEETLKKINQNFFFKWLLPPEFFDKMPQDKKNLVEIMLNEMSLADIMMIISVFGDLDEFKTYYAGHGSKPEGWYFQYEAPTYGSRPDENGIRANGSIMDLMSLYSPFKPLFPTKEFLDEYQGILDEAYLGEKENQFSFNNGFMGTLYGLEKTDYKGVAFMYKGRPYFKKPAHFFGYEKDTREPNEDEKYLLSLMENTGYKNMEVAIGRYERWNEMMPGQSHFRIASQKTPEPETLSQPALENADPQATRENKRQDARQIDALDTPDSAIAQNLSRKEAPSSSGSTKSSATQNEIPSIETNSNQQEKEAKIEFTFARFKKEPFSFIRDLAYWLANQIKMIFGKN